MVSKTFQKTFIVSKLFLSFIIVSILLATGCSTNKKYEVIKLPDNSEKILFENNEWSYDIGKQVTLFIDLPKENKIAFTTGDSFFHILSRNKGEIIGGIDLKSVVDINDDDYFHKGIALDKSRLLLVSFRGWFVIIDMVSESVIQSRHVLKESIDSVEVYDDMLIYSTRGSIIEALSIDTLEKTWTYTTNEPHSSTNFVIKDEKIIANDSESVFFLNVHNGALMGRLDDRLIII